MLANREDPDDMQHVAAFHQDLHCLLRLKQPTGTSGFIMPILQPNTGCFPIQKRPVFSKFWRFFSQPEDFIGIYSKTQKAKAV